MSALKTLLRKEALQLMRSRSALATATLLPALLLMVAPLGQMAALLRADHKGWETVLPPNFRAPPGLVGIERDASVLLRFLMGCLVAMGGLVVPAVAASYTMVAERESRTLELLAALPVRIRDVLGAKLAVIFALAVAVTTAMLTLDVVVMLRLHLATVPFVLSLFVLLLCALLYSTASALLMSLLARDFRTANQLGGALLGPTTVIAVVVLAYGPPGALAVLVLALIFLVAAGIALYVALRVVTFERLLR
ncbi:MAG: ABC transporter permease subunit [Deltaproteobacteria bacterium]|nr:ABC transporter permease subunit [Deltaproteobacteria bacterium]